MCMKSPNSSNSRSKLDRCSQYSRSECSDCDPLPSRRDDAVGGGLDRARERRAQRFLVTALTAYGLCLCPLMILRLARLALIETYDNSGHFDVTYALFVWLAFAPTCVTPVAFAAWQTSGSRMDRLRGYFRFSNHKFRHSCETVMTTTMGTPPAPSHRPPSRRCPQLPDDTASDTNSSHHETVSSHHETIDLRHETKYFINETSDFIHETSDLRNETNDMRRSPNNGARHETGGLRYETVGVRHETGRCHRETSLT